MNDLWEFIKEVLDPESIIQHGGLALLLFVIFAETGLLIGFFLPGDSLVFISGLICASQPDLLHVHISVLLISMTVAAVLGNMAGYWFGRRVGPKLFDRDDSLIFKKRYLETTQSFYDRHGAKALILGRFLPIIRTFAPILAGVIRVNFPLFMLYNITGAALWICSIGLAGYFLGEYEPVKNNVGWIVIGLVVITLIPVIKTYRKERSLHKKDKP